MSNIKTIEEYNKQVEKIEKSLSKLLISSDQELEDIIEKLKKLILKTYDMIIDINKVPKRKGRTVNVIHDPVIKNCIKLVVGKTYDFNKIIDCIINDLIISELESLNARLLSRNVQPKTEKNIVDIKLISEAIPKIEAYQKNNDLANIVKNEFIKLMSNNYIVGEGLYQNILNQYRKQFYPRVRPLLDGEYHLPKHNFTGPGTRIDLEYVRNYAPYNDIDACSKEHDLAYLEASKQSNPVTKAKMIRDADIKAIACYDKYKKEDGYDLAKLGIENKMKLENFAPGIMKNLTGDYFGKY